jgi:DNA gyrase/topoisomerase IV subunit A
MKRVIAITVTLVIACASVTYGQASSTVSLADVARKEEARRKTAKKATKVFTNENLATVDTPISTVSSAPTVSSNATASTTEPTIPGGKVEPPPAKGDQAFWQSRISQARTALTRTQMFFDSLQTKINSLRTDFTNRDNRVEREKIQQDLNTALAELERLKKELDTQQKAITAIEDEARRAGVPSGWLRPPA